MRSTLLAALALIGCNTNQASPNANPNPSRAPISKATYDMSTPDAITFVFGKDGLQNRLDQITSGAKLGETWTYVRIPAGALDPGMRSGSIRLDAPGVAIAHEFFGDDPTTRTPTSKDYRLDFVTAPNTTTGMLTFDRNVGGTVAMDVTYKGTSTVYGPPTYIEFEIKTGFPLKAR